MQKINFILLNLGLSSNFPVYIILNWNHIFKIDDSVDIMAITGILFIISVFLYTILKLEIFSLFTKYSKFFKYEAQILNNIKSNKKLKKIFLVFACIIDIFFFMLNYFVFKYINWNADFLILMYVFSLGGVFISYVSFFIEPWFKKRFNENAKV